VADRHKFITLEAIHINDTSTPLEPFRQSPSYNCGQANMLQRAHQKNCSCKKRARMKQPQHKWHLVHTDCFANNQPLYANISKWGCRPLVDFGIRLDVNYSLKLQRLHLCSKVSKSSSVLTGIVAPGVNNTRAACT
jgi:hypothetical protein